MELVAIIKSFVTLFSLSVIFLFIISYILFRLKNKKENKKIKTELENESLKKINKDSEANPSKKTSLKFKVINELNESF